MSYIQEVHRKFLGWQSAAERYKLTLLQNDLDPILMTQNEMLLRFEDYLFALRRWEAALLKVSQSARASSQPQREGHDN